MHRPASICLSSKFPLLLFSPAIIHKAVRNLMDKACVWTLTKPYGFSDEMNLYVCYFFPISIMIVAHIVQLVH